LTGLSAGNPNEYQYIESLYREERREANAKRLRSQKVMVCGAKVQRATCLDPGMVKTDYRKKSKTYLGKTSSGETVLVYRGKQSLVGKQVVIRRNVEKLFQGNRLELPFLTEKENLAVTMRALGCSRAKIAKTLSGGRRGWRVNTFAVKGILARAYRKCRDNKMEVKVNGKFLQFQFR